VIESADEQATALDIVARSDLVHANLRPAASAPA
jgi:hypothetical protein